MPKKFCFLNIIFINIIEPIDIEAIAIRCVTGEISVFLYRFKCINFDKYSLVYLEADKKAKFPE